MNLRSSAFEPGGLMRALDGRVHQVRELLAVYAQVP